DRPFLYEKLTGREFLRFVSGLWGLDGTKAESRAEELLELFELSGWKDTLVESYSHGMRQKLLISSAFVHGPELIVVDEPMVGLDPKAARLIKDLLRSFVDQGGTVFLSTHTLEVAEALCERIAIIQEGAIRAEGTMDELPAGGVGRLSMPGAPGAAGAPEGRAGRRVGGLGQLLTPKLQAVRRRSAEAASFGRVAALGTVGFMFWLVLFGMIFRMLLYFRGAAGIGEALAIKLLGLILLAFLSILLLSNVVTSLSSFFLAQDMELLMASPVDGAYVYGARLVETMTQSSWMVALVMVPVLTAYGIAYHGGLLFAGVSMLALISLFVLPAVVGSAVTLVLVNVFPARRARDLLALIALFGAAAIILLIRLLRPEQLASPEGFRNLVDFMAALRAPQSAWLPSEWAAEAMTAPLTSGRPDYFPLLLLVSTAAAFVVLGAWLHARFFAEGFSRAQEGAALKEDGGRTDRRLVERLLVGRKVSTRALVAKDVRTFFRDTTQWSQLILLAVLVVVYVYNIKVLPLYTGERVGFFLTNVVSFLNLGLAGFVLAAIAARFLFPAISLEGRTLWLLRSSPLDLRALVWTKYWVGIGPLLVIALALTAGTNWILRVGPFMMTLSLLTIAIVTFAVAALALGYGALFPRFDTDNAADIPTGFGGLLFMMTATAYLGGMIALEAWPVYAVLRARLDGVPLGSGRIGGLVTGLALALLLSGVAIVVPLRIAVRRTAELEP
ncbi:MAG: ATP-binding cassette domain-containing protein, partial [Gemmatimonadota bacterium]